MGTQKGSGGMKKEKIKLKDYVEELFYLLVFIIFSITFIGAIFVVVRNIK